jgi:hypothetical protein
MSVNKDRLRTKLGRRPQRHSGVHTKFARLIGSRRHYPTLVPLPANHYCFPLQRWIKQLFHRHEERVHVDVKNGFDRIEQEKTRARILPA